MLILLASMSLCSFILLATGLLRKRKGFLYSGSVLLMAVLFVGEGWVFALPIAPVLALLMTSFMMKSLNKNENT